MNLMEFRKLRSGLQLNTSRVSGDELAGVENRFREVLVDSGAFEEIEVEHTDDPDQLVIAMGRFRPEYGERDVADLLASIWNERIKDSYWDASFCMLDEEQVEFEAATKNRSTGHYMTLHMVAQRSHAPTQPAPMALAG